MDGIIDTLATSLGGGIGWLAEHGILFLTFAVLWVVFAAGLIWSQVTVDQAWQTIRGWPLVAQIVMWILFLPVMVGAWIWETTWPLAIRLMLVVSIAGWNLLVFLPRAAQVVKG